MSNLAQENHFGLVRGKLWADVGKGEHWKASFCGWEMEDVTHQRTVKWENSAKIRRGSFSGLMSLREEFKESSGTLHRAGDFISNFCRKLGTWVISKLPKWPKGFPDFFHFEARTWQRKTVISLYKICRYDEGRSNHPKWSDSLTLMPMLTSVWFVLWKHRRINHFFLRRSWECPKYGRVPHFCSAQRNCFKIDAITKFSLQRPRHDWRR